MKMLVMASAAGGLSLVGCVQQHVSESLAEVAVVEGRRYAEEIDAQSPFDTVEIRWSEAEALMEQRNRTFIAARRTYEAAAGEKPLVGELTREVKNAVTLSIGDVFKPDALLASLRTPATQLPKQLASISRLKNLSHQIEQSAWDDAATSVEAELAMRREKVRLHRLLRMGELIDAELQRVNAAPRAPADADPKLVAAFQGWKSNLADEREKWLTEVRDLFDAEYHDVRFIHDRSGLPTYHDTDHPDLGEWRRWCRLRRSKELVTALGKAHETHKPAIPGTELVTTKLAEIVGREPAAAPPVRDTASVREEVRSLIENWREMKAAQEQAARLEKAGTKASPDPLATVGTRRKIFQLRRDEIERASVVWMLDEQCWQ